LISKSQQIATKLPASCHQIASFSHYKGRNRQFGGILLALYWHPGSNVVTTLYFVFSYKPGKTKDQALHR